MAAQDEASKGKRKKKQQLLFVDRLKLTTGGFERWLHDIGHRLRNVLHLHPVRVHGRLRPAGDIVDSRKRPSKEPEEERKRENEKARKRERERESESSFSSASSARMGNSLGICARPLLDFTSIWSARGAKPTVLSRSGSASRSTEGPGARPMIEFSSEVPGNCGFEIPAKVHPDYRISRVLI
ncbi:hypothetical protein VTO42DRAFT_8704 [Malbranchea cinnamomea]